MVYRILAVASRPSSLAVFKLCLCLNPPANGARPPYSHSTGTPCSFNLGLALPKNLCEGPGIWPDGSRGINGMLTLSKNIFVDARFNPNSWYICHMDKICDT